MPDASVRELIQEAILSHTRWGESIESEIRHSKTSADVAKASDDESCSFGGWLHSSSVPKEMLESPYYSVVCKMHSAFL